MRRRLLTLLCLLYLGVLMYASLMPFEFGADEIVFNQRLERVWLHWPFEPDARISGSDALSNLLLYVPLGVLVAARCRFVRKLPGPFVLVVPVILAAITSAVIEYLQAYLLTRTPSGLDWMLNVSGCLGGAVGGAVWGPAAWIRSVRWVRLRWSQRPVAVAAGVLLALVAADALAPFMPTILMKEVWRSLKRSHFGLTEAVGLHPWHWWLVARVGVAAGLTSLLAASSKAGRRRTWWRAAALAACFMIGLEMCKPLIQGRHINVANVLFSVCGCGLALAVGPVLARRLSRSAKLNMGIMALGAYIVYLECFTLTLHHDVTGFTIEDVRLFVSTAILCGGLICLCRFKWNWLDRASPLSRAVKAVALSASLGAALQLTQFYPSGRGQPSMAIVLCFALGGVLGAGIRLPRSADADGDAVKIKTVC